MSDFEIGDKVYRAWEPDYDRRIGEVINIEDDMITVEFPETDSLMGRTDKYYENELVKIEDKSEDANEELFEVVLKYADDEGKNISELDIESAPEIAEYCTDFLGKEVTVEEVEKIIEDEIEDMEALKADLGSNEQPYLVEVVDRESDTITEELYYDSYRDAEAGYDEKKQELGSNEKSYVRLSKLNSEGEYVLVENNMQESSMSEASEPHRQAVIEKFAKYIDLMLDGTSVNWNCGLDAIKDFVYSENVFFHQFSRGAEDPEYWGLDKNPNFQEPRLRAKVMGHKEVALTPEENAYFWDLNDARHMTLAKEVAKVLQKEHATAPEETKSEDATTSGTIATVGDTPIVTCGKGKTPVVAEPTPISPDYKKLKEALKG